MRHLIHEKRDDKGGNDHKNPADTAQHVGCLIAQSTSRLIDMGHEEAHHTGYQIPRQVDNSQESDCLDSNLVGKQQLYIVDDAILVFRLVGSKLSTLLQLTL